MTYAHFITARLVEGRKPYWAVDGCFNGPEATMAAKAQHWADCFKNDAGKGPATIVLQVPDGAEAAAIYRAKVLTMREVDQLKSMEAAA